MPQFFHKEISNAVICLRSDYAGQGGLQLVILAPEENNPSDKIAGYLRNALEKYNIEGGVALTYVETGQSPPISPAVSERQYGIEIRPRLLEHNFRETIYNIEGNYQDILRSLAETELKYLGTKATIKSFDKALQDPPRPKASEHNNIALTGEPKRIIRESELNLLIGKTLLDAGIPADRITNAIDIIRATLPVLGEYDASRDPSEKIECLNTCFANALTAVGVTGEEQERAVTDLHKAIMETIHKNLSRPQGEFPGL